jgi:hypothetical protein
MLRNFFVVGFIFTTVAKMLIEGKFLGYNTKYIIGEQKKTMMNLCYFLGSRQDPLCFLQLFTWQTKLVRIKKQPCIGLILDFKKELKKTTHMLTKTFVSNFLAYVVDVCGVGG